MQTDTITLARHCQGSEEEQGAAPADAVCQPSARILVDTVEQILAGAEETDDQTAGTERRKVRRYVGSPQFLTQRKPEEARRQDGDVAIEPQNGAERRGSRTHVGVRHPIDQESQLEFGSVANLGCADLPCLPLPPNIAEFRTRPDTAPAVRSCGPSCGRPRDS